MKNVSKNHKSKKDKTKEAHKTFRINLRNICEENGIKTKKQLEDWVKRRTSINVNNVHAWWHGRTIPTKENAIELCKLLQCDMNYLLGNTEHKIYDFEFFKEETNLSDDAIQTLIQLKEEKIRTKHYSEIMNRNNQAIKILDDLLCNENFVLLLLKIADYKNELPYLLGTADESDEVKLFSINNLFTQIVKKIANYDIELSKIHNKKHK